jgi:hypothetical protein
MCEIISPEKQKLGERINAIHVENNNKRRDIYVLKSSEKLKEVYLDSIRYGGKNEFGWQRTVTIKCS